MKRNNFDFTDAWIAVITGGIVLVLLAAPITGVMQVLTTQKALNEQCGTNYNFLQVATAGDNLSRLCQIKNQTVTIK
jgi:energy-converting hydrogenase Eha subunit C